ncbi:MAG: AsmA family protein [Candidatus Nitrohelix vancouverensis]|uniref:AsmA family protein n=1 Tax=Candidatus Nitrohelix vancouverensis TaxID=2705534 RepID=A0A7T0C504_9BACT|nr:MAG: AsmA family protein [Candidatus Nitrohelix vancouverensis]
MSTSVPPEVPPVAPKRKGKIVLVVLLALFLATGSVALFFIANLQQYRDPLQKQLSQSTGLDIHFEKIGLGLSGGLGLRCEGLQVKTKDLSRKLFGAGDLNLVLEWSPLLNGEIKIKKAVLSRPSIDLNLNPASTPPAPSTEAPQKKDAPKAEPLSPEQLHWKVAQFRLRQIHLNVDSLEVDNGEIRIIQVNNGKESVAPVRFSGALSIQRTPDRLDVSISQLNLRPGDLQLQGSLKGVDLLSANALLKLDLESKNPSLDQLEVFKAFLPPSAAKLLVSENRLDAMTFSLEATPGASNGAPLLKATLSGQALRAKLSAEPLSVQSLRVDLKAPRLDQASAHSVLEGIEQGKIALKDLKADWLWDGKTIRAENGRIQPAHGQVTFSGQLEQSSSKFSAQYQGDDLRLEDFSPQRIRGGASFKGRIQGTLPKDKNTPAKMDATKLLLESLSGQNQIQLAQGKLLPLETWGEVLHFLKPSAGTTLLKEGLGFEKFGGDFNIQRGRVRTDNLHLLEKKIHLKAKGEAHLIQRTLNAEVRGLPMELLKQIAAPLPDLGPILQDGQLEKAVYLTVKGPWEKPAVGVLIDPKAVSQPEQLIKNLLNFAFPNR